MGGDSYESKLPLLFAPRGQSAWAVTLGQHTWYSVAEDRVDPAWRRHEECHKRQWQRDGYIVFVVRYLWQLAALV